MRAREFERLEWWCWFCLAIVACSIPGACLTVLALTESTATVAVDFTGGEP